MLQFLAFIYVDTSDYAYPVELLVVRARKKKTISATIVLRQFGFSWLFTSNWDF